MLFVYVYCGSCFISGHSYIWSNTILHITYHSAAIHVRVSKLCEFANTDLTTYFGLHLSGGSEINASPLITVHLIRNEVQCSYGQVKLLTDAGYL